MTRPHLSALKEALEGIPETFGPLCLVTGGAGFFGSALIEALLLLGCRVRLFDLLPAFEDDPRVEVRLGDLRDEAAVEEACEGISTVFHTAALINLLTCDTPESRALTHAINVLGTEHVVRGCRARGVPRLIYISSVNVCFERALHHADETTPYAARFIDLYTETKVAAEKIALGADSASAGLRSVALRPGGGGGPGDGGVMLQTFVRELAAGRFKATIGDGTALADNTHVYNLAQAALRAAWKLTETPDLIGGGAYFITDEEPINAIEWFRPIVEALGHTYPRFHVPTRLMLPIASLMERIQRAGGPTAPITRSGVLKIALTHTFSTARARRELGYRPTLDRNTGLPLCMDALQLLHDDLARRP